MCCGRNSPSCVRPRDRIHGSGTYSGYRPRLGALLATERVPAFLAARFFATGAARRTAVLLVAAVFRTAGLFAAVRFVAVRFAGALLAVVLFATADLAGALRTAFLAAAAFFT